MTIYTGWLLAVYGVAIIIIDGFVGLLDRYLDIERLLGLDPLRRVEPAAQSPV